MYCASTSGVSTSGHSGYRCREYTGNISTWLGFIHTAWDASLPVIEHTWTPESSRSPDSIPSCTRPHTALILMPVTAAISWRVKRGAGKLPRVNSSVRQMEKSSLMAEPNDYSSAMVTMLDRDKNATKIVMMYPVTKIVMNKFTGEYVQ